MSEATRYRKDLSNLALDHPFALLRRQLVPGDTVLDLGCGSGEFGAYLAASGIIVDGVEANEARADIARKHLRKVLVGSICEAIEGLEARYSAATLIDVVEHLVDPIPALRLAADRADIGYVFIPNAAHYSVRSKILRGDWSYDDSGTFDRDHLRFYDLDTMQQLIDRAGLRRVHCSPRISAPKWAPAKVLGRWPRLFASAALIQFTL